MVGNYLNKLSFYLMAIILAILLLHVNALALPGDLNGSGRVDGFDLIMFGRANGSGPANANWNPDADMNQDGTVDGEDLEILSGHFGKNGIGFGLWVGAETGTERVFKLSSTGNTLLKNSLLSKPVSVTGDIYDNAVWVADSYTDQVKKLSGADGSEILAVSGVDPYSVSADPRNGSVWVADYLNNRVVKLLPSVTDGYTVGTDTGHHTVVSGFYRPRWVSINPDTGVIWVADTGNHTVVRLSPDVPDGYNIRTATGSHTAKSGFSSPYCVSVNSADGTAWVADYGNDQVVKLSATGTTEIVRVDGFNQPKALDTSYVDGSVWIADYNNHQAVRLASDGSLICRVGGVSYPYSIGVNPLDGSAWVADYGNSQIVRLSSSGTELKRIGGILKPITISVIPDEVTDSRYPSARTEVNPNNSDPGETITFSGTGDDPDGTITLYEWDFDGDGVMDFSSPSTGETTYSYTTEGLYNPVFRVTDDSWLTDTDYSQIVRVGALKAVASADITSGSAPLEVDFTGRFIDPINGFVDSFQWDFDGDNIFDYFSETAPDITHTYTEPGQYNATFKVTDGPHTATDQITIDVAVSSPVASANASPNAGAPPLKVTFSGSCTDPDGTVMLYEWDFEDDGTYDWFSLSGPDTYYTYTDEGSHTARLRVTDNDGLTGSATVDVAVGASARPLAAVADADKTSGRAPLLVTVNASGSSIGNIVKYEWNFGDCPLFYDSMEAGTGQWQADLPWSLDQADYHSQNTAWTDSPGVNYSDNANRSLATTALDLSAVSSATLSFWHHYETERYRDYCRLEISVDGGATWQQLRYFYGTLTEWTEVETDISAYLPNPDVRIRFRLTSDGDTNYDGWSIDDVKICSSEADWTTTPDGNASHTYIQSGRFTAILRVTDADDNRETDTLDIQVAPASFPDAATDATPKTGDVPVTVTFTASASDTNGTIAAYDWNFGEEYVWVADQSNDEVVRACQDGTCEMARIGGFNDPYSISVNPNDGTVWIADYYKNSVVRLSADGQTELVRAEGFYYPISVSVNPSDGTVWVADYYNNQVVKLASDGTELVRSDGFYRPYCVSVNPTDGSVWVADYNNHQVVKLAADGSGLARISGFSTPISLSVNSADGTVWVADTGSDTVIRLSPGIRDGYDMGEDTGSHLILEGFYNPYSVAVNSADDTVWVADNYNNQVVHLASDGAELSRTDGFYQPTGVSVNPSTGIVWVADYYNNQVVKLSSNGREIARLSGFYRPRAVAVSDTGSGNYYNSETGGNTTHTYTIPGIYHAVFTATDDDGNSVSKSADISVFGAPEVAASADISSGSAPLEVFLTATVTELSGKVIRYEWDFDGDGIYDTISDSGPNARHIYANAGTYPATIRVTTDIGYSNTDSVTITITPGPPSAHAEAVPFQGNVPLSVNLHGTGTDPDGTIVKYEWDFENDGIFDFISASTGSTAHTYTTPNTYTAVLRVTDNSGLSATDSVEIIAETSGKPSAFIYSPSPPQGFSPYEVLFFFQGIDPDGTIARYEIDYEGDGTFETITPTAFGDDMESGTGYWSAGGSWAQISTDAYSPSYCWTDSPEGNYPDSADLSLTSATINLTTAATPKLIFWHKFSFKSSDYGRVEVSDNDGGSWSQIKYFTNSTQAEWARTELDLSSYAGNATVKIRFRLTSNTSDTADGWYIDNVWVGDAIAHTYSGFGVYSAALRVTDNEGNSAVTSLKISVLADENRSNIWVADFYNDRVVKLSDMGEFLVRVGGFNNPRMVEADPVTGDVWVSDTDNDRVVKLSKDVPDGHDISVIYTPDETSGKNNGGLLGNAVVTPGKFSQAVSLDGSGDFVRISADPDLDVQSFTLEAWINSTSVNNRAIFMRGNNSGRDEIYFGFYNNSRIDVILGDSGTSSFTGTADFADGNWHHVALVYDAPAEDLRCYADGALYGDPVSKTASLDFGDSNALIGADYDSFNASLGNYFFGLVDDVRLWNTARTATEIVGNKDTVLAGNESGLAGYWKLDLSQTMHQTVIPGFDNPFGLSVNPSDSSVWVVDRSHYQIVRLASDGTETKRISGFYNPWDIVVNPADGSVWVSDTSNDRVVKLSPDVPDGFVASARGITDDATPNQHLSMVMGNVAADAGKLSGSMWFDGSGDYIVISPDPELDVQDFTVEAWVKSSYVNSKAIFMRGSETGGNEIYFGFSNSSTVEAIIGSGESVYFSGSVSVTDGEWHHVALVYDSAEIRCYMDGAPYGDPASVAVSAPLNFGESQALIGADFDGFNISLGNYFNGYIDDVRLWNTARTEAEIAGSLNGEISGTTAGLAGYWKLNSIADSYAQIFDGFNRPYGISLDPSDNGVWVADFYNNQVVKLGADGSEIYRKGGFNRPLSVALNPNDFTVWVPDNENDRMVKLRPDAVEAAWSPGFHSPHDAAVHPEDSTVWVADRYNDQMVKLGPDGTELLRVSDFNDPISVSIDSAVRNRPQPPTADTAATPSAGNVPMEVSFSGTGSDDGSIAGYAWDFDGDGVYDYESTTTGNTSFTYSETGTFSPIFRVTDNTGLATYASPGLIYVGPMTAHPAASPVIGDAPLKVNLDGNVSGLAPGRYITDYEWDFEGDGVYDFSSAESPVTSYTYQLGNSYTAILRVTDNLGNQAYASTDVQVNRQVPIAYNYATPVSGNVPLTVTLNGSGRDYDGSIIRYEWDYNGDGTYDWFSASESNTSFTYQTAGTYEAVIKVTDNDGLIGTAAKTITVDVSQSAPDADASASVTEGPTPLAVTFSGTATDPDGQIQLYEWDFDGNGTVDYSSSESGNTSHTYSSSGLFNTLFRVTDADGLTDTVSILIEVKESSAPTAYANADPTTGETPLTVSFHGAGSSDPDGNIVRYDWSFGNDAVWVADYNNDRVMRLYGYEPDSVLDGFDNPYRTAVNASDGTLWVSDYNHNQVVKLDANGNRELLRLDGFYRPYGLSVDPTDGSVWVADYDHHQVVKLNASGTETLRLDGFDNPTSVAVNTSDRSVWITDYDHNQVVRISADGEELARIGGFYKPYWVSVYQVDGSAWIADRYNDRVVKLSAAVPAGYTTDVQSVTSETLSGDPAMAFGNTSAGIGFLSGGMAFDGSGDYLLIADDTLSEVNSFTIEAWILGEYVNSRAIFMRGNASGGNELYFGFYNTSTVEAIIDDSSNLRFSGSANFMDGNWHHVALSYDATTDILSCFVDGSAYGTPVSISADLDFEGSHALIGADFDGFNKSLGNYFKGRIDDVRLWDIPRTAAELAGAKDAELSGSESGLVAYWKLNTSEESPYHQALSGFDEPFCVTVNPADGSAWVCDYRHKQMVRVSPDCTREILRIDGFNWPYEAAVDPSNGNIWVADYSDSQIVVLNNEGRELRRISGFNNPTSVAIFPISQNRISLMSDQIVTHTYPNTGEFEASLTVTDNDGYSDTDTISIKAGIFPKSIPIAYPTTGDAPLTVRFSANGYSPNGTLDYYEWDFNGDGTTDWSTRISENHTYTYGQAGTYTATQTVMDQRGLTDTEALTITVLPAEDAPIVSASADQTEGGAPLAVILTGLARDSDGTIVLYEWDFEGNGTYDYSSSVSGITSHTYGGIGIYLATLRVTDNEGKQGTDSVRIEVKAEGAPAATAEASVTSGTAALNVGFTGSATDDGTIVKYEWDFDGNGAYDYSSTVSGDADHIYTLPGSFDAVLRVTDNVGLTDTATVNIYVSAGITASLNRDIFDPTAGETVDINSVLSVPATVTILVTDRSGGVIRTLVKNAARSPGYFSDSWDGKNDGGQVMESGAYLYVIEYETGGQKYVYDVTNNVDLNRYTPSVTYPDAFNPFNAETNFFRYTLDAKSEVTVYISPFTSGAGERIKTLLLRMPQKAGSYVLTWDGTDDAGDLVTGGNYVIAVMAWQLPDNAIIINTRPVLSDLLATPTYVNPDAPPYSDEYQAEFSYTLSKLADVSVSIYDTLNYIVRTLSAEDVPAGNGNTIFWDGKNNDAENVTPGIYRVKLIATDANGSRSYDANALLIIFY